MQSRLDIAYNGGGDPACRLDLHWPEVACRAVYVYFHGGGLESGDKSGGQNMIRALTDAGIAVASANYRMYPKAQYPDYLEDATDAVAWAAQRAEEAGVPVFIGGSSAGGYITMMLCFAPFLARVGLAPEAIAGFVLDAGQPTTHFNVLRERGEDSRRIVVDEAAPLFHIQGDAPLRPLLIFLAEEDMPGRYEQTLLLRRTLLHFEYPPSLITWHEMAGYRHCGYCGDILPDGSYPYAKALLAFFEGALSAPM